MRVLFMGSGEIALPSLLWLLKEPEIEVIGVVTQPDKPVGRHQILTASAIKLAAMASGVPVFQPVKVREAAALEVLAALVPDLIVVMAYGQILPKALLDLPKVACLNLHASLLPRHRGASPIQAAILAGDPTTGITLMHMDIGLDTGDIVLARKINLAADETGGTLHDRLAELGPLVLEEALPLFREGCAPRSPQDSTAVTLSTKLDRDSGRLDWSQPASELERRIRAMHPWPGAFTTLPNGKKLKIHLAGLASETGQPGEILVANGGRLIIAAGEGSIRLEEIQVEGKSRLPAADFLRGNPLRLGELLPFRA